MEDYIKDSADTASSNFFESFGKAEQSSVFQREQQPFKIFDQPEPNVNRIQELESRLLALNSILDQLKDHFDKVNSDTSLDDSHNDRMSNLEQLRTSNEAIEKQIKRDIFEKFDRLDRELKDMERNRKQMKSKYENLLSEGLEEVKALKQSTFKEINQLKEEKSQQFKKQTLSFKKELQKLKKSQRNFKSSIFGNLELARSKFQERVRNEQNKRNNLENIIHFLLEKTCKKAEGSIQRRVYEQPYCGL